MSERRQVLLRIDPAVHDALMRWANDELRSVNAQIEMLLRRALTRGRAHAQAGGTAAQAGPAPGDTPRLNRRRARCAGTAVRPPRPDRPLQRAPGQRQAGAPRRAPA